MALINSDNRNEYIRLMTIHYKKSEEQIRKEVEQDPEILEGFAEYLANGGRVSAI